MDGYVPDASLAKLTKETGPSLLNASAYNHNVPNSTVILRTDSNDRYVRDKLDPSKLASYAR